jgi:lipoyl(octanoyl) transferase
VSDEILVVRCGLVPYGEALVAQRWVQSARQDDEAPDVLLLLEHPPVYTRGRRATEEELPMRREWYEMQGIEVHDTDRGGRVTYHGPGQLVAYPIVSLRPYGDDVHEYVRRLERVAVAALAEHGVAAGTIEGLTGVWTNPSARQRDGNGTMSPVSGPSTWERLGPVPVAGNEARKIGSIGVHVSRGVTTHGLAINVNNDLQPFEWIVPCGIDNCRVTSLSRELGAEQDLNAFADTVVARFADVFERVPVATEPATLGLDSARLGVA